jgi:hypothetical protein
LAVMMSWAKRLVSRSRLAERSGERGKGDNRGHGLWTQLLLGQ